MSSTPIPGLQLARRGDTVPVFLRGIVGGAPQRDDERVPPPAERPYWAPPEPGDDVESRDAPETPPPAREEPEAVRNTIRQPSTNGRAAPPPETPPPPPGPSGSADPPRQRKQREAWSNAQAVKLALGYTTGGLPRAMELFPDVAPKDLIRKLASVGIVVGVSDEVKASITAFLDDFSDDAMALQFIAAEARRMGALLDEA